MFSKSQAVKSKPQPCSSLWTPLSNLSSYDGWISQDLLNAGTLTLKSDDGSTSEEFCSLFPDRYLNLFH